MRTYLWDTTLGTDPFMEESINNTIIPLLESRVAGPFKWLSDDLKSILERSGGENDRGTLRIGFNPLFGPCYVSCIIHAPMVASLADVPIPASYMNILRRFNGAKFHAIDFFGMLEDESNRRTCLSLTDANRFWINEYRRLPSGAFHFGGRSYNRVENAGYFLNRSLEVFSALKSGRILNKWPSIDAMLLDEYEVAKVIEVERRKRLMGRRRRNTTSGS